MAGLNLLLASGCVKSYFLIFSKSSSHSPIELFANLFSEKAPSDGLVRKFVSYKIVLKELSACNSCRRVLW